MGLKPKDLVNIAIRWLKPTAMDRSIAGIKYRNLLLLILAKANGNG